MGKIVFWFFVFILFFKKLINIKEKKFFNEFLYLWRIVM